MAPLSNTVIPMLLYDPSVLLIDEVGSSKSLGIEYRGITASIIISLVLSLSISLISTLNFSTLLKLKS